MKCLRENGAPPRHDWRGFFGRPALPVRVCVKTDLLPSLTVGVPFGALSNEPHAEPRASARGARPQFSNGRIFTPTPERAPGVAS